MTDQHSMEQPAALLALTPRKRFFELMRRLDALDGARTTGAFTDTGRKPAWLHLEQSAAMHFASSEVAEVKVLANSNDSNDASPRLKVVTRHFGLFAPYGPLPLHATEHAMLEKLYERNPAFEQFLNLISADMAWLHYRSWSSMHPALGYERQRHPFADRIGSLAQIDPQPQAHDKPNQHLSLPGDLGHDHSIRCRRSWPGLYLGAQRPLRALRRLLRHYFGAPIAVFPRAGRWLAVPSESERVRQTGRWRLGSRMWDVQNTLDIEVGPIDAECFGKWHRRSPAVQALVALAFDYAGGALHPAVHVLVRTRPELAGRLGRMRIGIDAWSHPGHQSVRIDVHESLEFAGSL